LVYIEEGRLKNAMRCLDKTVAKWRKLNGEEVPKPKRKSKKSEKEEDREWRPY
jgi:hypothetical protein